LVIHLKANRPMSEEVAIRVLVYAFGTRFDRFNLLVTEPTLRRRDGFDRLAKICVDRFDCFQ
jgi:hypothetical protein